ncbi:MAG: ABC transporter substrate-binding protein [Candidatus Rokubacteria bacterium]|nr:ABC transporter substrate-binding protein [Candidatus Rokubacteria bacterium]MBI4594570.1 ABC transporter substrate-binding protein [Candidatus Rokubacteria bacterium]
MTHITRRVFLKTSAIMGGAVTLSAFPYVSRLALGQSPIKWGSLHPFTGAYASEAIDQRAGVEIALEEINAEGGVLGRKVEGVFRDTEFNPAATKRKAVELLENEKVDFIGGSLVGFEEIALNELACKHGFIYANYPQHILSFKGKLCKYFFTANLTPFQLATAAGRFAAKQGWGKRWHMLGDNYSWPQMALRGYEKVAKEMGADWTGVTWAPFPTQDYSSQIPKIQAVRPDVLFVTNFGADQVGFVKQAREFGLTKQMRISITNTEVTVAEAVGKGGFEGIHAGMPWYWEEQSNPRAKKFVDAFMKKRNRAPMAYSGTAYTLVRLILDTANEIKSLDKDKLVRALEGKKFTYLKGEEQVRGCDHAVITDIYYTVGKPASAMKGQFDFFTVVQKLSGEELLESCESQGWDPKKPASAQS